MCSALIFQLLMVLLFSWNIRKHFLLRLLALAAFSVTGLTFLCLYWELWNAVFLCLFGFFWGGGSRVRISLQCNRNIEDKNKSKIMLRSTSKWGGRLYVENHHPKSWLVNLDRICFLQQFFFFLSIHYSIRIETETVFT